MLFGGNRESRTREAAGRRNWPEAVPKKMRDRKRDSLLNSTEIGCLVMAQEPQPAKKKAEGHTC